MKVWTCRLILAVVLITAGMLFQERFRFAIVVGGSMRPNLNTGDLLLVDKGAFLQRPPVRGEVVVARHDGDLIVKRVVGLPGEEVALHAGHLYINGEEVVESHPLLGGPLEVSRGRLFESRFALLGDNREIGIYELVHAVVGLDDLLGKVVWAFQWPWRRQTPALSS